ncbi:MAG: glycosyltransferase family 4 protein [Anaerolineae bacterium]|nr:glycosyltransferase family 4 protein [Anaerolineae bacterium]
MVSSNQQDCGEGRLRITFLLTQSLESPSGLGRYWPLCRELSFLGHDVTILALHPNYSGLNCRHFVRDGVKVYYVGQMHVKKIDSQKLYFHPLALIWITLLATAKLMYMALHIPSDIYHICKPHPMNSLAALLTNAVRKALLYLDCDDYEAISNRFEGNWQKHIVRFFEDKLPSFASGITVNTRFMMERLIRMGYPQERIVLVPNGVDRQRFRDLQGHRESIRQKLGISAHKVVAYVGSLSLTNHAVDLLLEAFTIIQRQNAQAILLLVGGGEDYNKLQVVCKELGLSGSVRFVGWIPPEIVPMYYFAADVSVDPARDTLAERARCPLKIVESLAAGTPVVSGDVGDRSALLSFGGGIIVPPGNPEALAEAILAIIEDDSLRARLSAEAREASEYYYWDRLVHDFVKVYEATN